MVLPLSQSKIVVIIILTQGPNNNNKYLARSAAVGVVLLA